MSKDNYPKNNLLPFILSMLVLGTPAVYLYIYKNTSSITEAITATFLYFSIFGISAIMGRLWKVFEDKISFEFQKFLDELWKSFSSKHEKDYIQHIIATNSFLDYRPVDAKYNFELSGNKGVYVNLSFTRPSSEDILGKDLDLLRQIKTAKRGKCYVILGKPGSGKTTCIKYMALRLAENRKMPFFKKQKNIPNKFPIMFDFQQNAPIVDNTLSLASYLASLFSNLSLPVAWIEKLLESGKCVIFVDALDAVADPETRIKVIHWLRSQIQRYSKCAFILSSRPHGYENNRLSEVETIELEVSKMSKENSSEFIHKWYYADEVIRSTSILIDGLKNQREKLEQAKIRADNLADKLIERLDTHKALGQLANNPLLLTMITVLFGAKQNLPGRRVELYDAIIQANFDRRPSSKDLLGKNQKATVLQKIAYDMMEQRITAIPKADLFEIIQQPLTLVNDQVSADAFVKLIVDDYAIMVEEENGLFAFTHLSFQEYLASVQIKENGKEKLELLKSRINDEWWQEVIRLYVAQTDATPILVSCRAELQKYPRPLPILKLTTEILAEARSMSSDIRLALKQLLQEIAEDVNPLQRNQVAEAYITIRINSIQAKSGLLIDDNLITNLEYQLFADFQANSVDYVYPDQWLSGIFPRGQAFSPVVGVRPLDAIKFCRWLTKFDLGPTQYRLPTPIEAMSLPIENKEFTYFVQANDGTVKRADEVNSTVILFKENAISIFEDDIKVVFALKNAIEYKDESRPTSTEILSRTPVLGTGGSEWRSRASAGGTGYTAYQYENFENSLLYEEYEIYAKFLGVNLSSYINNICNTLSYKTPAGTQGFDWLMTQSHILDDLGQKCSEIKSILEEPESLYFLGITPYLDQSLIKALDHVITRDWFILMPNPNIEIPIQFQSKRVYGFLRWYCRIGLLYLINHINQKNAENLPGYAQRERILGYAKGLIRDFIVLEDRIVQPVTVKEGIRILKSSA